MTAAREPIMPKILYIEDTENNRILVERKLRRSGYDVLSAEDAERGLALVAQERPDLILMDMGLPGLDGWEATRRLKADRRLRHIPVIALTAHAMAGDKERSLAAGCEDYDVKPFDFDRLLEKIGALVGPGKAGGV
jgi:CheY-like chemotaxis protein